MLCSIGILKCFLVRFIFNARQEKENSLKCSERTETKKKSVEFVSWHSLSISCQYIITLRVCSETFSLHWLGIFERGEFLPVQPLTLLHGTVQILFQIAELFAV